MIGQDYLNKLWKSGTGKIKGAVRPLLKDGIGDKMDKGNLWIVPGFTVLAFAVLWCTKLSKIALEESTCRGASPYHPPGSLLDEEAIRHCQTAKRYYVGINEAFSYETTWREARQVKNPEWILWFGAPIVFVMYVLTRYMWSLLMENQGINFTNVVNSAQSVVVENDGVTEIDPDRLDDRVPVIADNFRCAGSSNAFAAFILFELILVLAPLLLLFGVLPIMIGGAYRTYGMDVARAWWEKREWQGTPIRPFFGDEADTPVIPLIPRITYCDYHYVTLMNDHVVTYRCYLDSTWHERTALFTWYMLVLLTLINLCNLFFWFLWACRMRCRKKRQKWVMKKWLDRDDFTDDDRKFVKRFAEHWKMGSLLLFYYIEAHTDRVVASAFAHELWKLWMDRHHQTGGPAFVVNVQKPRPRPMPRNIESEKLLNPEPNDIGWNTDSTGWGNTGWGSSGFGAEPSAPPKSDTPGTLDTGFSEVETAPYPETPSKRSSTPSTKQNGFYNSNLTSRSPPPLQNDDWGDGGWDSAPKRTISPPPRAPPNNYSGYNSKRARTPPRNDDWGEPSGASSSPSKYKDKKKFDKKKKDNENSDNKNLNYQCAIM